MSDGSYYYRCFDGQEWEHPNEFENDGTPDNSGLTSVETDGIAGTSPSVRFENEEYT